VKARTYSGLISATSEGYVRSEYFVPLASQLSRFLGSPRYKVIFFPI